MDKIGKCVLFHDDCLKRLPKIKENSIDSCITDPPYNLASITKRFGGNNAPCQEGSDGRFKRLSKGFMGKAWDSEVAFDPETWAEVYRVMKPGAHLLAFGGTRTYHRMACAIEDAGFEIRDCIMWVYGSGFPKSHDMSKAIDRLKGSERKVVAQGKGGTKIGSKGSGLRHDCYGIGGDKKEGESVYPITESATDEAKQWEGWGTALKPAVEPIVVARKPLSEKTVAANVLKWGTGALNIDASRVELTGKNDPRLGGKGDWGTGAMAKSCYGKFEGKRTGSSEQGRWPANLIHDGSDEVTELFPDSKSTGGSGDKSMGALGKTKYGKYALDRKGANIGGLGDEGSNARFFYCAKASKKERGEYNTHATVKPVALMEYLVNLVTPPEGRVLDLFMGSGTTALACIETGHAFVGVELEQDHYEIAKKRLEDKLYSNLEAIL